MKILSDPARSKLPKNNRRPKCVLPEKRPGQIYQRILVGTDFSECSNAAFEQALTLAKQNGAELLIAHAAVVPASVSFIPPEAYGEWEIYFRKDAEKSMEALLQKARHAGVKAHVLLLEGLADDALMEAAGRLGVDLIVIGTHGRHGLSKFFMGSVAAEVISRAPCAVLTARTDK